MRLDPRIVGHLEAALLVPRVLHDDPAKQAYADGFRRGVIATLAMAAGMSFDEAIDVSAESWSKWKKNATGRGFFYRQPGARSKEGRKK